MAGFGELKGRLERRLMGRSRFALLLNERLPGNLSYIEAADLQSAQLPTKITRAFEIYP